MSRLIFSVLLLAGYVFGGQSGVLRAQEICCPDSVLLIDRFEYLHRYGNIYIGGQPDKDQLDWLKSKGVTQFVNLRTPKENRVFTRKNFDAGEYVISMGFEYTEVPVGGGDDSEHPDKLGEISEVINTGEKVLIYCKTGARARYVLMAYLVREKDCPYETAKKVLLKMGSFFPLDTLFGNEIRMEE